MGFLDETVVRRPGDIAECCVDASKAERELGWTAKRDLVDMCLMSGGSRKIIKGFT